jgi:hypothetical protein
MVESSSVAAAILPGSLACALRDDKGNGYPSADV